MKKCISVLLTVLTVLALCPSIGCKRVKPQSAANRPQADSTAQALMLLNLSLAEEADKLLADSVKASSLPYVLDLSNFWYCRLNTTDGREIGKQMHVEYAAVIRDLATGELLEEVTEETEVGSRKALRAIDICLSLMREGETFLILAPYYTAFGRDGNEQVAPLTNVKIELTANNITRYEKNKRH